METSIIGLALCILGLAYSLYTDLKYREINNKAVALLILAGVILNRFEALKNLLIVFLITFILWNFGVISAGDSKVFLFISSLVPSATKTYLYSFPTAVIINSILLSFPIFLIYGILKSSELLTKKFLFREIRTKIISTAKALMIISSAYIISKHLEVSMLLSILLITAITIVAEKRFKEIYIVYTPALLFAAFTETRTIILIFIAIFLINLIIFLLKLSSLGLKREKNIDELKEGEILAGAVYGDGRFVESIKERIKIKEKPLIAPMARGLTREEIEILKKLKREGKINKVKIRDSVPFVPSIFAGFLFAYFIGDLSLIFRDLLKALLY